MLLNIAIINNLIIPPLSTIIYGYQCYHIPGHKLKIPNSYKFVWTRINLLLYICEYPLIKHLSRIDKLYHEWSTVT